MQHGRHSRVRPHHWVAAALAVLVTVSIATGLGWLYRAGQDDNVTSPTSSPTAASSPTGEAAALAGCARVWQAQTTALGAAGRAAEQWRVHVGAMNQLVAGEITLAQARAYWNRTRVGAASRVAKFEAADGEYADLAPDCPGSSGGSKELATCTSGIAARDRALSAGAASIATWKHHITDMDLLRAGQITPEQATRMWLASWRAGVAQLDTFTRLRRDAADAGGC